jgi:hypothetical protein
MAIQFLVYESVMIDFVLIGGGPFHDRIMIQVSDDG